jgi:hypothetical protein
MKPEDRVLQKIERLVLELRTIERWSAAHWRSRRNDARAMLAFEKCRNRRSEILSELIAILPSVKGN